MQSIVHQRGRAKIPKKPRGTVKNIVPQRGRAEHSAEKGSAEHSPRGAMLSTLPQKGRAKEKCQIWAAQYTLTKRQGKSPKMTVDA